jgi:hypothetical protein
MDPLTIDLERLRLPLQPITELLAKKPKRPPRPQGKAEFLKGPIPLAWLAVAARLPGKVLATALAIWFDAGRKRRAEVTLTHAILQRFGVNRKAAYRALEAMQKARLIAVARHPGRSPVVTILDCPESGD